MVEFLVSSSLEFVLIGCGLKACCMKKRHNGVVVKASAAKTVRVDVQRVYRHERYGKILRRTMVCHVHDARGECKVGDHVEIVESRPISRMKRWSLVGISSQ